MELVITAKKTGIFPKIKEILRFKELLYFFIWRDIKVRYKQTVLGALWVIIQPVLLVVTFSLIFGAINFGTSSSVPYPVLAFIGVFFWQLFSNIVTNVGNSIISNQNIIQKIYFPNILIPLSAASVSIFDALIIAIILLAAFLLYGVSISFSFILLLILGLIITVVFALGFGIFLGALNVKYRDVRHILPFIIQILFFLSPVFYTHEYIPQKFADFLVLNPLTGVILGARSAIDGFGNLPWAELGWAGLIAVIVLMIGLLTFNRTEREFADLI